MLSPSFLLALACAPLVAQQPGQLLEPVLVKAGGAWIDVTVGHAAPYMMDVDGDGVRDLLVGEFGDQTFDPSRLPAELVKAGGYGYEDGRLRVYRNVGTATAPRFEGFEYLATASGPASIPTT